MSRSMWSDIEDRISAMRKKEEEAIYRCSDYKRINDSVMAESHNKPVDDICRFKMCDWCFQVIESCDFRRETAAVAISNLDRFMCTRDGREVLIDRDTYKLAVITSLYIAIKIYEPVQLKVCTLSALSRGIFCEEDFITMEKRILKALEWRVAGPNSVHYVDTLTNSTVFTDLAGGVYAASIVTEIATRQTVMAIKEYDFIGDHLPSEIAFAAILNAAAEAVNVGIVTPAVQRRIGYFLEKCLKLRMEDTRKPRMLLRQLSWRSSSDTTTVHSTSSYQHHDDNEEEKGVFVTTTTTGVIQEKASTTTPEVSPTPKASQDRSPVCIAEEDVPI